LTSATYTHEEYILKKHGQEVIEELELKHLIPLDSRDAPMRAMEQYYTERYDELIQKYGLFNG
jgi:hypothetical protein